MAESIRMKGNKYWDSSGIYDSGAEKTLTFDHIYPVGSIYMSVNPTDPSNLFGGTWEQLQNKFLLAASSTHAAGSTGGSENAIVPYHNHSFTGSSVNTGAESRSHTHSGTTGNQSQNHTHLVSPKYFLGSGSQGIDGTAIQGNIKAYTATASAYHAMPSVYSDGNTKDHNHQFTSGTASQNHTHAVTAAGTVGYAGTNGNVNGANMPPYLAVYMWKRTA